MAFTDTNALKYIAADWPVRLQRVHEQNDDEFYEFAVHADAYNNQNDALAERIRVMSKKELQQAYKEQRTRSDNIWRDYVRLRQHVEPRSDPNLRSLQMALWVTYVAGTLTEKQIHEAIMHNNGIVEEWPAVLGQTGKSFEYARIAGTSKTVAVSTQPLGLYTPSTLMTALRAFVDAVDALGWTESASSYFMALYWRYALIVQKPAENAMGDGGEFAALEPDAMCTFLKPAPLTPSFLDISEKLIFHHLYRIRALKRLVPSGAMQHGLNLNAARAWDQWRRSAGTHAFLTALSAALADPMLAEDVHETYTNVCMGRFLYPGEVEFVKFSYPDERDITSDVVLFKTRTDVHQRISQIQRESPLKTLLDYFKAISDSASFAAGSAPKDRVYGDGTYGAYVEYVTQYMRPWETERLILLLFEVCFDIDVSTKNETGVFCAHSYADDRSLAAPSDRPPISIGNTRAALDTNDPMPTIIVIWQFYIVIRAPVAGNKAHIYFMSPHLLDALAVWMHLAQLDGHLKLDGLRAPWAACCRGIPLEYLAVNQPL